MNIRVLTPAAEFAVELTAEDRADFIRELYARDGAALKVFVTRLSAGDWYRAEDIVQETMMRAWRNAAALAEFGRSVRPWLFTVARRLVIDAKRLRDTRPREVGDEAAMNSLAVHEKGYSAVVSRDEIVRALSTLPPPQREILILAHYRGMAVDEIADLLGIPSGTVKSRTYSALRTLRSNLKTAAAS